MAESKFVHIHASGYAHANPDAIARDISRYRKLGSLITTTEHKVWSHRQPLIALGWDSYTGHECYTTWRTDIWELAWKPSVLELKSWRYKKGTNPKSYTRLEFIPLRHKPSGRVVRVRVAHMPSRVQGGERWRGQTPRVFAYQKALRVWGQKTRQAMRQHPQQAQLNVADWNLDLHRFYWRALIMSFLQQKCVYSTHKPKEGSHGNRLIDGAFYFLLRPIAAKVLSRGRSSDHRAVATVFAVEAKP